MNIFSSNHQFLKNFVLNSRVDLFCDEKSGSNYCLLLIKSCLKDLGINNCHLSIRLDTDYRLTREGWRWDLRGSHRSRSQSRHSDLSPIDSFRPQYTCSTSGHTTWDNLMIAISWNRLYTSWLKVNLQLVYFDKSNKRQKQDKLKINWILPPCIFEGKSLLYVRKISTKSHLLLYIVQNVSYHIKWQ